VSTSSSYCHQCYCYSLASGDDSSCYCCYCHCAVMLLPLPLPCCLHFLSIDSLVHWMSISSFVIVILIVLAGLIDTVATIVIVCCHDALLSSSLTSYVVLMATPYKQIAANCVTFASMYESMRMLRIWLCVDCVWQCLRRKSIF